MFMVPETVPANRPPISIAAGHAQGITRSLQKLATAIDSTAATAFSARVESNRKQEAPANPTHETNLRDHRRSAVRRTRKALAQAPAPLPRPPKNSGKVPSSAVEVIARPRPS